MFPGPPWDTTEWQSPSQAEHLPKQTRGRSSSTPNEIGVTSGVPWRLSCWRCRKTPDLCGGDGGETRVRRMRRAEGRRRKRKTQRPGSRKTTEVVTWNVQGLSLRENNWRSLRRTLAYIERRKWDITLLTEIRAEASFGLVRRRVRLQLSIQRRPRWCWEEMERREAEKEILGKIHDGQDRKYEDYGSVPTPLE